MVWDGGSQVEKVASVLKVQEGEGFHEGETWREEANKIHITQSTSFDSGIQSG